MSYNQLTDQQEELLALVIEECSEVIKAATKILRHGCVTEWGGHDYDNRTELEREMADVYVMIKALIKTDFVSHQRIVSHVAHKRATVHRWTHTLNAEDFQV